MKIKKTKHICQINWLPKKTMNDYIKRKDWENLPIPKDAWLGDYNEENKSYEVLAYRK